MSDRSLGFGVPDGSLAAEDRPAQVVWRDLGISSDVGFQALQPLNGAVDGAFRSHGENWPVEHRYENHDR